MKKKPSRVVGLDVHPDSFAGAILVGQDPATAQVVHQSTQVPLEELERWAKAHTTDTDVLVLESSANSFAVAGRLREMGRRVIVLESHQASQVGTAYCANDRTDAIKLGRIQLSGLAKRVWQPDEQTRERREVFSGYQAVVRESTRHQQQLKSLLNEHSLRLQAGYRLNQPKALEKLLALKAWSPAQRLLISQSHEALAQSRKRRGELRRLMAQEILAEPMAKKLARVSGLSLVTIYGLMAAIGDINRFANAKKLVAYIGLNPSVCQSGNWEGGGALKPHGNGPLRAVLIQAAQRLLTADNHLKQWGRQVAQRRGWNKATVAVARKLVVAAWHILMGHPIQVVEKESALQTKIFKWATDIGKDTLLALGHPSKQAFTNQIVYELKSYA